MKFLIILLAFGCSAAKDIPASPTDIDRIESKLSRYIEYASHHADAHGWVERSCDGLLFNSLYGVGGGTVDIEKAMSVQGKWHRSTTHDCWPDRSGSSISRDMLLGLFIWIWQHGRLDLIEQTISYGENHRGTLGWWIMGEGDKNRTVMRPNFMGTAYELMFHLGGLDHKDRNNKQLWTPVKGYARNLQALHVWFRYLLTNRKSPLGYHLIGKYARTDDRNALFCAVIGDGICVASSLLDTSLFPDDRLPSSADRCEPYLWQRDQHGNDWKPCPEEGRIHPGIDFIIAATVYLQRVRVSDEHERDYFQHDQGSGEESSDFSEVRDTSWLQDSGHYSLDLSGDPN
jgi:hypothetical protein